MLPQAEHVSMIAWRSAKAAASRKRRNRPPKDVVS